MITENFGHAAGNAHRVLEELYKTPIISIKEVQEFTGTSYPPANDLVKRMEENKILVEITGQKRHRKFMYMDFVNLFRENSQ